MIEFNPKTLAITTLWFEQAQIVQGSLIHSTLPAVCPVFGGVLGHNMRKLSHGVLDKPAGPRYFISVKRRLNPRQLPDGDYLPQFWGGRAPSALPPSIVRGFLPCLPLGKALCV